MNVEERRSEQYIKQMHVISQFSWKSVSVPCCSLLENFSASFGVIWLGIRNKNYNWRKAVSHNF